MKLKYGVNLVAAEFNNFVLTRMIIVSNDDDHITGTVFKSGDELGDEWTFDINLCSDKNLEHLEKRVEEYLTKEVRHEAPIDPRFVSRNVDLVNEWPQL